MYKALLTAVREYRTTVMTTAFILGVFAVPLIATGAIALIATGLFDTEKPTLSGRITVADRTPDQFVADGLAAFFSPEEQVARAEADAAAIEQALDDSPVPVNEEQRAMARRMAQAATFDIELVRLSADADLEAEKRRVIEPDGPLMLMTVDGGVLEPEGGYGLYHSNNVAPDRVRTIRNEVDRLVVDRRLREAGYDPQRIRMLQRSPKADMTTVTAAGEAKTQAGLAEFLPFIFFIILWISVMSGGQYLLMSTIEEKSSRVMEVLLSAISPLQLMVGKIIGQGAVGLTILVIYGGLGILAAGQFDVLDQIPTQLLAWLAVYFVMAYFLFASMMAAAGSAVSDVREANSLLTPIMLLLMVPFFLWFPISQNPNSVLSQAISFFPPATPFVMVLRMCQPGVTIPLWEIVATTVVGFAGVLFMVWAAAKIFRIGVLMYGKPPSMIGLVKWLRYK